jgi:hypothetical protein
VKVGCRHCRCCDVCRVDFDHHCFFLNNCVTPSSPSPHSTRRCSAFG